MRHLLRGLALLLALGLPTRVSAQTLPLSYNQMCTGRGGESAIFIRDAMPLVAGMAATADRDPGIFYQNQLELTFAEGMSVVIGRPDLRPYWTDALTRVTVQPSGQVWAHDFRQEARLVPLDETQLVTDLLVPGKNIIEVTLETQTGSTAASPSIWVIVWQACQNVQPSDLTARPLAARSSAAASQANSTPGSTLASAPVSSMGATTVADTATRQISTPVTTTVPTMEATPLPVPTMTGDRLTAWPRRGQWILGLSVLCCGLIWTMSRRQTR